MSACTYLDYMPHTSVREVAAQARRSVPVVTMSLYPKWSSEVVWASGMVGMHPKCLQNLTLLCLPAVCACISLELNVKKGKRRTREENNRSRVRFQVLTAASMKMDVC
jgi:hypothetical protein